jgi:hypothetical protein
LKKPKAPTFLPRIITSKALKSGHMWLLFANPDQLIKEDEVATSFEGSNDRSVIGEAIECEKYILNLIYHSQFKLRVEAELEALVQEEHINDFYNEAFDELLTQ